MSRLPGSSLARTEAPNPSPKRQRVHPPNPSSKRQRVHPHPHGFQFRPGATLERAMHSLALRAGIHAVRCGAEARNRRHIIHRSHPLAPFAFVAVGSTPVVPALTRCRIASRSSAIRGEVFNRASRRRVRLGTLSARDRPRRSARSRERLRYAAAEPGATGLRMGAWRCDNDDASKP